MERHIYIYNAMRNVSQLKTTSASSILIEEALVVFH